MTDFKVGDKVYYFFHANDCSLIWDLKDFDIMESEITKINKYARPEFDNGYEFYDEQPFFKTKNEAIDAMIKRLEGFKE